MRTVAEPPNGPVGSLRHRAPSTHRRHRKSPYLDPRGRRNNESLLSLPLQTMQGSASSGHMSRRPTIGRGNLPFQLFAAKAPKDGPARYHLRRSSRGAAMGYDISWSLHRPRRLDERERRALIAHVCEQREMIVGYDLALPGDDVTETGDLIAWGSLRPSHGDPARADHGGHLPDVVERVLDALAALRALVPDVELAVSDDFTTYAWCDDGWEPDGDGAPRRRRRARPGGCTPAATRRRRRRASDERERERASRPSGALRPRGAHRRVGRCLPRAQAHTGDARGGGAATRDHEAA
jgi:hypothetical protein